MLNKKLYFFIFLIAILSCNDEVEPLDKTYKLNKELDLTDKEIKSWYLKCIENDTIPGISFEKTIEFLKNKDSDSILVAVLDASFDLNHEDLKQVIWNNPNEKANFEDDDKNGYKDDLNGWNFIGNSNKQLPLYENYEFVRVVRYYDLIFKNEIDTSTSELKNKYAEYKEAKEYLKNKISPIYEQIEYGHSSIENYFDEYKILEPYLFEKEEILSGQLDSIYQNYPELKSKTETISLLTEYEMSIDDLKEDLAFRERLINIYYNTEFDERKEIGDNPNDFNDTNYGNNLVDGLKDKISHGTYVSGLIAADRTNNIGIKGISNKVKILPVVVAVNGEAHDKDLALGIRYAVDNGSKIINISISKKFSLFKEWVFEAIEYAASKDVLIIVAAGNDNVNLDKAKNFYPNDTNYNQPEIANNFLMVGGSSYSISKNLKFAESNYGKETVDIMAPAHRIYTTASNNSYEFVDGTSFSAPIVTGIAALLRSNYPTLRANEIKKIIMDSGTEYDVMVNISNNEENDELVPFSSLSKSGKIVNSYNAILMAEDMTKRD